MKISKKRSRILKWGMLALAELLCVYLGTHNMLKWETGGVILDFQILPFILLGGLCGNVSLMICCALIFLIRLFSHDGMAYTTFILMMSGAIYDVFVVRGWLKRTGRLLLSIPVAVAILGALEYVCYGMIDQYRFGMEDNMRFYNGYLSVGVPVLLGSLLLFFWFRFHAQMLQKRISYGSLYYSIEIDDDLLEEYGSSRVLSSRITWIILAEAVIITVSAILFTSVLFPDLRQMMQEATPGLRPEELMTETGRQEIRQALEDAEFVLNNYSIAYILKMILMLFCVAMPVASLANFYAQIRIAHPITRIAAFMSRFASGDREQMVRYAEASDRMKIRSRDEVEQLYKAVNHTVHDMVDQLDRIEREQKLEEDLRVAKAANEAKSGFLSNMSHEIRTPINAVLGMDEIILRTTKEPETRQHALDLRNAGKTLLALVNDILDFSRIEAGKLEILPVEYDLSSTLNDLVNMISGRAADKHLDFEVQVEEQIPHMLIGDEIRIKQCAVNILTNAVKYTEQGSVKLEVGFRKADDRHIGLRFRVSDTGIGMKEEDLNRLYKPFERIEEVRNRTIEGTGLGMSIVQKLLAMMDTQLQVKSVYGEGSDFSFEVLQEVADWEPIGNFTETYREISASAADYQESFHAPTGRILIVDDTKMNLTVACGLLEETQLQVDTAMSGAETLALVVEKNYDVIFLDHRMPDMDGIETLQAMQTLEGNRNLQTPCIALTANAVAGAREQYLEAGFADYLTKPIDPVKFEKMLIRYLPGDKVILQGDPRFDAEETTLGSRDAYGEGTGSGETQTDMSSAEAELKKLRDRLSQLEGIDLTAALEHCGGKENILAEAVEDFRTAIPSKSGAIEQYAAAEDFRNYTVLVHALKSSARLIGAQQLSEDARYLEQCGNDENAGEIREKTPALVELYRSYTDKLAPILGDRVSDASGTEDGRPEIPEEDLKEALDGLKEFVEAYDFDSADRICKMLSDYRIPESCREKYDKIKELMAAVDRDQLLEVL